MVKTIFRILLGAFFILAGILHFTTPDPYLKMMPPFIPFHLFMVYASGVVEAVGGVMVLIPATRRAGGWLLMLTLLAIFPANVYMAINGVQPFPFEVSAATAWGRLPIQGLFWAWVWWTCLAKSAPSDSNESSATK